MAFHRKLLRELHRRTLVARARAWIRLNPRAALRIRDQRAWLFGGSVGRAYADNSAALHQFVREEHPSIQAYWVIDKDSPDLDVARSMGPILLRGSVEACVHALLAEVMIVSHGVHDIPGLSSRACQAFRVRLGHGITATRVRRPHMLRSVERLNRLFDLVPVSSEFEKRIKMGWDIAEDRLAVTGVPRFDTLVRRAARDGPRKRQILYMPTWRDGTVASLAQFRQSAYAAGIGRLLNSRTLHDVLERHDAGLRVVFHSIARPHALKTFEHACSPRILIEGDIDPQGLFAASEALVTDYSSVAWDMLYLNRKLFFYQFDLEQFSAERGTHLGPDVGWPGPVCRTAEELAGALDEWLSGEGVDGHEEARLEHVKTIVFAYRDSQNCARVFAEIERRLADRRQRAPSAGRW